MYLPGLHHTGRNRGDDAVHHTKVALLMARDTNVGSTQSCERLICNTFLTQLTASVAMVSDLKSPVQLAKFHS